MNPEAILRNLSLVFGTAATPGQAFDAIMTMRREGVTLDEVRIACGNEKITTPCPPDEARPPLPTQGAYTDSTLMPWGKHRGTKLGQVPKSYWRWLQDQPDPIRDKRLAAWLNSKNPRKPAHSMDDVNDVEIGELPTIGGEDPQPPMEGDDVPF